MNMSDSLKDLSYYEKWTGQHDTSVGQRKRLPEHLEGALSTGQQELVESNVI